tara:strand:+ start:11 stop:214 length:204 start_codon:yes stop_codon:yes gene_type:complete
MVMYQKLKWQEVRNNHNTLLALLFKNKKAFTKKAFLLCIIYSITKILAKKHLQLAIILRKLLASIGQ